MKEKRELGRWSGLVSRRSWVQFLATVITNSWFTREVTKGIPCLSLNCYACPLSAAACPIGTLQHFAGIQQFPFYLLGVLALAGALGGRFACGWFCPFGWLQEWMYKLPLPKWTVQPRQRARWWILLVVTAAYAVGAWVVLHYAPAVQSLFAAYLVLGLALYALLGASRLYSLVGMSLVLPLLLLEPWFCKLCPAGMLEGGIPQVLIDPALRALVGPLFWLKMLVLVASLAWMGVTRRPFCRWVCPLGAIWSPFNRWSVLRMTVDRNACIECDRCRQVCPVDIQIYQDANAGACVRCLRCVDECPVSCIYVGGV
jgi:ferredoxin-type protein NapH